MSAWAIVEASRGREARDDGREARVDAGDEREEAFQMGRAAEGGLSRETGMAPACPKERVSGER